MSKVIAIIGSSREKGNTRLILDEVIKNQNIEIVSLAEKNISYYDYEHKNRNDDFISIISKIVQCDQIIFASPVYWYSLSAPMKIFVDRFSDLLRIEKEKGRQLKGKKTYLISTGSEEHCPECFEQAFKLTCDYLGMHYQGMLYCYFENNLTLPPNAIEQAQQFSKKIFAD